MLDAAMILSKKFLICAIVTTKRERVARRAIALSSTSSTLFFDILAVAVEALDAKKSVASYFLFQSGIIGHCCGSTSRMESVISASAI
jgi:hypothetical protein